MPLRGLQVLMVNSIRLSNSRLSTTQLQRLLEHAEAGRKLQHLPSLWL